MSIKSKIHNLRPFPNNLSMRKEVLMSVYIVILGLAMALLAKITDSISIIGEIGTEIGVWVFVATIIAAYSRYPLSAAVNVLLFFLSMLFAYYLYGHIVLGFSPRRYFFGWLIITWISPFAGFIVWFSKAKGIIGSIITALSAAILFAHGYPAFYTLRLSLLFSLIMGSILCTILPITIRNKAVSFVVAILMALVIDRLYLFSFLPF